MQDHTTSVGITAAAFMPADADNSAQSSGHSTSHLKTHADLRYAVALLLLAAEALPVQDVEFTVCRLLFNQASTLSCDCSSIRQAKRLLTASSQVSILWCDCSSIRQAKRPLTAPQPGKHTIY